MKTVYFRIVLAAVAAAIGAASQAYPQYAGILQAIAGFVGGISVPAESVQKAVMLAPKIVPLLVLGFLRLFCAFVISASLLLGMSGCAGLGGFSPLVAKALSYANDAGLLLQALREAWDFYSKSGSVSAQDQQEVAQLFQDATLSADAATRALHGVQDLTQADINAAYQDFKPAYTALVARLVKLGAVSPAAPAAGPQSIMATHGKAPTVRVPLVFEPNS